MCFWSDECDLCMKLRYLLFHDILYSSVCLLFLFCLQTTNRNEEVLRCVYSRETMHALGGGLGTCGCSYREKGLYVINSHFMCTI